MDRASTVEARLECSAQAALLSWLISGVVYCGVVCVYARSLDPISMWLWWGSALILLGWIAVGLPIVSLGDRFRKVSLLVASLGTGLAGALLMLVLISLDILLESHDPRVFPIGWNAALFWMAPGFAVASITGCLYRILLARALLRKPVSRLL